MAAPADLDLAFSADAELPVEPPETAAPWLDPLAGAELWHRLLGTWLAELAVELPAELRAPGYSLGLSLVDDTAIAALNGEWRGQAGPTDVLAFAARDEAPGPVPPGEPLELGDIVISVDTAARQAPEHGHALERELWFLASHGLLHLLGWDHPDEASLAAMLARQDLLLRSPGQPG